MWPDLAKYCHFGKPILECLLNLLMVYLFFGTILNQIWHFYAFGQTFIAAKGHILKNLAIWSHCFNACVGERVSSRSTSGTEACVKNVNSFKILSRWRQYSFRKTTYFHRAFTCLRLLGKKDTNVSLRVTEPTLDKGSFTLATEVCGFHSGWLRAVEK